MNHNQPSFRFNGFTLIEILIALTIFAILATITSSVLYNSFTTRTRVNEQSKRLSELQLAISFIQQDTIQAADRPIRSNEMQLLASFIGQKNYLEFTRDGDINPGSIEKRSTLKRVAYVCQQGALIRRTWDSLDIINPKIYEDKILISNLSNCYFGYLNQNLQVLTEWRGEAVNLNQRKEPLPKAVQFNMTLKDQGDMNLLFILPGALYAAN